MSVPALVGSTVSYAQTVLRYFSPDKSPYYSIIAFGCLALTYWGGDPSPVWFFVAFPVYAVLLMFLLFSLNDRPKMTVVEYTEQLRFARSLSISTGLLCLVYGGRELASESQFQRSPFWIVYAACLLQVAMFAIYAYARSKKEEPPAPYSNRNFVQFSLITSTFLSFGSYCMAQYTVQDGAPHKVLTALQKEHYFQVGLALYALWLVCACLWIKHIGTLITFKLVIPDESPDTPDSEYSRVTRAAATSAKTIVDK